MPQIVTYEVREKVKKRTKVSFSKVYHDASTGATAVGEKARLQMR